MHRHRASNLKQSNKSHKSNKSSKRSLNKRAGGKVQKVQKQNVKKTTAANGVSKAKANRKLITKQRRQASKDKLLQLRRSQGRSAPTLSGLNEFSSSGTLAVTPRLVGIISLSEREHDLETSVTNFLLGNSDETNGSVPESSSVSAKYSKFKREGHITYLPNSCAFRSTYTENYNNDDASIQASLDLCRVCDMVLFLLDGSDADKKSSSMNYDDDITGMNIGDGLSTQTVKTSTTSNTQFDYDHLISSRGDRILSAIKAQGLPTPLAILVNQEGGENSDSDTMSLTSCSSLKSIRRSALKKRLELKKYISRFATTEFGENVCRVMDLDLPVDLQDKNEQNTMQEDSDIQDISQSNVLMIGKTKKILPPSLASKSLIQDHHPTRAALLRTICTTSASPPKWVADMPRSYILSESNSDSLGYSYDPTRRELQVTGFIRGRVPWNVNSLVHLPNIGTFGMKRINSCIPPLSVSRKLKKKSEEKVINSMGSIEVDSEKRESLNMFADADALEGEQNLIGFEEENNFEEASEENGEFNKGFARPAGWNDYQSAWLDAIQDDDNNDVMDFGELAFDLNKKKDSSDTVATEIQMDEMDANDVTEKERRVLIDQRKKDQEDEVQFPDEVEIKEDDKARERFARYRSLKSFRKSYWDPKENLPLSYSTIFHFDSFRATQGDVMADMKDLANAVSLPTAFTSKSADDNMVDEDELSYDAELLEGCVPSGSYVTITIENVSQTAYNRVSSASLLTAVCLLPHEHKMSVIHMALSQTTQCDQHQSDDLPVKSKDVLTFRCGWRTWQSRPIFSQNNLNSDKHKFERFLPTGGAFFAASVLGPVTYAPTPVMVFRQGNKGLGNTQLVAIGTILNVDADRIVVKRIVLTGFPTRVHKRHATVKYMFFTPEDVKWFKPAEITTKHGLQGNILESVGDHGTMKCLFNAPIKQHDTVCLTLYKRVYPKYAPSEVTESETGSIIKHDILVL